MPKIMERIGKRLHAAYHNRAPLRPELNKLAVLRRLMEREIDRKPPG